MVGYSYRRVPAVALARRLVEQGRIGEIRHVRAQYLQDWIVDPEFPLVWRLQRSAAGSGALGDIGAHIVDMAQYLIGDLLTGVSALTETFVRERPLRRRRSSGLAASGGTEQRDRRRRRRGAVPRPLRRRRGGVVRGHPVRDGPQERAAHRAEREPRLAGVRPGADERAGVLRRRPRTPTPPGSAASSSPSRRTPTRARGGRPGTCSATSTRSPTRSWTWSRDIGEGRDPAPSFADGLRVQLVLDAVERVGGRRAAGRKWTRRADGTTDHVVHRPVGRPAVRGGRAAGGGVGLRRAGDRLLGRPLRPVGGRRGRRLRPRPPRHPGEARPAGLRDLQPPHRAGRLRRPDRRATPRDPARPGVGRRRARRRAAARGRGDAGDGAGRGRARREHGRRLHRVEDLEDRGDVPAGAASR